MMLRDYFLPEGQQRALAAYGRFACGKGWTIQEKIDLYESSCCAFGAAMGEDDAFRAFENIYKNLAGGWQVFRPDSPIVCWPSRQIFKTIQNEFKEFAWGGTLDLSNFMSSGKQEPLLLKLAKMEGIKSNKGYPVMAVSKFLHFYNPGLFPIYDYQVIWRKVFKRFKGEFKEFCFASKLPYNTEETGVFLRNYVCWASYLIGEAHPPRFMEAFVEWLGKQPGCKLPEGKFDARSLFATAFEFTAIGAANADLSN